MALGRETVERYANYADDLPAEQFLRQQIALVQEFGGHDDDAQRDRVLYAIATGGKYALQAYEIAMARDAMVERAVEDRTMLVAGKPWAEITTRSHTILQAFIPRGNMQYGFDPSDSDDPDVGLSLRAMASMGTYGETEGHRYAHTMVHVEHQPGDRNIVKDEIRGFLERGVLGDSLRPHPPAGGSVYFDNRIALNSIEDAERLGLPDWAANINILEDRQAQPHTSAMYGVFSLSGFIESLRRADKAPSRADQIRIIAMLAAAAEQAETGELGADGLEFMRNSATQGAGHNQWSNSRRLSDEVTSDWDYLTRKLGTITPISPFQKERRARDERFVEEIGKAGWVLDGPVLQEGENGVQVLKRPLSVHSLTSAELEARMRYRGHRRTFPDSFSTIDDETADRTIGRGAVRLEGVYTSLSDSFITRIKDIGYELTDAQEREAGLLNLAVEGLDETEADRARMDYSARISEVTTEILSLLQDDMAGDVYAGHPEAAAGIMLEMTELVDEIAGKSSADTKEVRREVLEVWFKHIENRRIQLGKEAGRQKHWVNDEMNDQAQLALGNLEKIGDITIELAAEQGSSINWRPEV